MGISSLHEKRRLPRMLHDLSLVALLKKVSKEILKTTKLLSVQQCCRLIIIIIIINWANWLYIVFVRIITDCRNAPAAKFTQLI